MVDADTHAKLKADYEKLEAQMTSLTQDFTTMNTQLMEAKSQNYDLIKREGDATKRETMYKTQLKQLTDHVSRAESELRKSKGALRSRSMSSSHVSPPRIVVVHLCRSVPLHGPSQ